MVHGDAMDEIVEEYAKLRVELESEGLRLHLKNK